MQPTKSAAETLPWDDIRLFLALYRARTMYQAAKSLGVNPSTVTRRLLALEDHLGFTLFHRGRDGLKPTEGAHQLLAAAEMVEHGVARFAYAADGLEQEIAGVVRLACPPDVADVFVLPMLRPLLAAHPKLRITLLPGEATLDLNRQEADLALRIVRPQRGDLVIRRLFEVRWIPAGAASLIEDLRRQHDLHAAPWLGWGAQLAETAMARWLSAHTGDDPVLRTDRLITLIAAASQGLGLALLPAPSVPLYNLTPLPLDDLPTEARAQLPKNELFLVSPQALRGVPRVRVVWEALLARLASPTAPP